MIRLRTLILFTVLLALVSPLAPTVGQDKPPTVAMGYTLEVLPGRDADFQAAMKKQVAWYKTNNETWAWHTWRIETGDGFGKYVFRSPGHHWKDMDDRAERGARARAHFMQNVRPHLASMTSSISDVLADLSRWPESVGIPKMVSVHEFQLHYGMHEEFVRAIGKIHEAIGKSNWPVHYAWSTRVSGGPAPTFWAVIPHKSWADMKGPDTPFRAMLESAVGRADADGILESLRHCVKEQTSVLAVFEPDLSYIPAR